MLNYKQKDQARDLYVNHNWSIKELENKFNQRMTDYVIPQYMRTDRAERIRAQKQRVINNRRALAKLAKQKAVRLNKQEAKQVKEMSEKLRVFKLDSVVMNIKRCPTNKWLMGG